VSYLVPAQVVVDEQIIKKSRFITHIQRAENKQQALDFIHHIKEQYPDARHHCWAYIAGHPLHTTDIAFSDDGEPQGTAGKPILNVLQHRQIGEVVLVVVRYFGGIKLGAGGLVRAYSSSAHLAVEQLQTQRLVPTKALTLIFDYTFEQRVQQFLKEKEISIVQANYLERISLHVHVAEQDISSVQHALIDITLGRISLAG